MTAVRQGGRKRVVIHEDDVGMSHGANTAFVELSKLGTCSSGSVMVPCPWFPEAAEIAAADPSLDLGVHVTLTSEQKPYRWRPLTAPPRSAGMTDEYGYFWPDVPSARKAAPEAVEAELRAQIDTALAAGIEPTHLDAHMGTAQMPEFVSIFRRLGHDYRLPVLLVKSLDRYNPASYAGPLDTARYDDELLPKTMSFAVEDVFVSAILAVACEVLAEIGEDHKRPHADVKDLYAWSERFRAGVIATTDQRTGAAKDYDVRGDGWIATETVAQFAPLLCGGLPHDRERSLLRLLEGPRFCGHPDLAYALIPSTSPVSRDFRPREYWRGPVWPVMTWLFSWCFARRGWAERSRTLRREGLRQASDGTFAEYYEPFSGEPLGSMQQSWTAAAVLDWLG